MSKNSKLKIDKIADSDRHSYSPVPVDPSIWIFQANNWILPQNEWLFIEIYHQWSCSTMQFFKNQHFNCLCSIHSHVYFCTGYPKRAIHFANNAKTNKVWFLFIHLWWICLYFVGKCFDHAICLNRFWFLSRPSLSPSLCWVINLMFVCNHNVCGSGNRLIWIL